MKKRHSICNTCGGIIRRQRSVFKNIARLHSADFLMAGFLYVGAGIGMIIIALVRKIRKTETNELKLTKSELPYTVAMILWT